MGCRPLNCRTTKLDPAMPQALISVDTIQVFSALLLVEILCNVLGMVAPSRSCRKPMARSKGLLRKLNEKIVYRGLGRVEGTDQ